MYRVFLFTAFLAYCSSIPFSGSNPKQTIIFGENDEVDIVDNPGAGYSYFKKQQIDSRPFAQPSRSMTSQDLSAYMHSSAFSQQGLQSQVSTTSNDQSVSDVFGQQQQQLVPRSNFRLQTLLPKTLQNTFGSIQPKQPSLSSQSNLLTRNIFDNQQQQDQFGQYQQQDSQPIDSQQILLPQTNLNTQQKTLTGFSKQQQDLSVLQQPQQYQQSQQFQQPQQFQQNTFTDSDNQQQDLSVVQQSQQFQQPQQFQQTQQPQQFQKPQQFQQTQQSQQFQQPQQIQRPQQTQQFQQNTLTDSDDQQQDLSFVQQPQQFQQTQQFQQPQQTQQFQQTQQPQQFQQRQQVQQPWSTQQKSFGFSSSVSNQGQQPVSSGFLMQSSQRNDMQPVTNAVFMSSQLPTQRFSSQSQPTRQVDSGSFNGW